MNSKTKSPARLWVLLAREAPVGVIFRRGPSKQVLLFKWNTRTDTLETGQWFKGRVYERRCDVSPNGELLIYFAAKQKPPLYSWTAVSKPPYFTALALWPKGDCWNGGGWFVDDKKIRLNHASGAELHRDFQLRRIKIAGYAECGGEDATVWDIVLRRDGWEKEDEGKARDRGGIRGWAISPPQRWRKPHPKWDGLSLEMFIRGIGGKGLPWYQINYRVVLGDVLLFDRGTLDWADWDHQGELVYAKDGCLFRHRFEKKRPSVSRLIADLNAFTFQEVPAPDLARQW